MKRLDTGETVATANDQVNCYSGGAVDITIHADSSDWEPGNYDAIEYTYYYSFGDWRESPNNGASTMFRVEKSIANKALTRGLHIVFRVADNLGSGIGGNLEVHHIAVEDRTAISLVVIAGR